MCRRVPDGMICLNSAASFWDLTDEIPGAVDVAVARGKHRPRIAYPSTRVHVFAADTFALGRVDQPVESSEAITISSKERKSSISPACAPGSGGTWPCRRCARSPGGDAKLGELLALARLLRIGTVMAEVLEPLLT